MGPSGLGLLLLLLVLRLVEEEEEEERLPRLGPRFFVDFLDALDFLDTFECSDLLCLLDSESYDLSLCESISSNSSTITYFVRSLGSGANQITKQVKLINGIYYDKDGRLINQFTWGA